MNTYRAGIDIGSTTVKLVILDDDGTLLYGQYRRHHAHTQGTLKSLLMEARRQLGDCRLRLRITGSGAINLGKALDIGFVQEVVAVATALKAAAPQTDVAIELGGEDAKIIYFKGGLEERMNGVCAGGTGSFIDQMASLLQTDAEGLNEAAKSYQRVYPIAARCGVFAKTDIQPLINEGATQDDLAVSIFQAVVNQTISGLACGKPIRGTVAFLGGPLHFLTELKAAFIRTLKLTPETTVDPDNSHLSAAMGAAMEAKDGEGVVLSELVSRLEKGVAVSFEMPRLEPLFRDQADFDAFQARHAQAVVGKGDLASYEGKCFLGIDAGSTTTKLAVIGEDGRLLYHFYRGNQGNPISTAQFAVSELKRLLPQKAKIVRACSTGYGEALLKAAFSLDEGVVETIAHTTAAAFFDPEVDCVLDIEVHQAEKRHGGYHPPERGLFLRLRLLYREFRHLPGLHRRGLCQGGSFCQGTRRPGYPVYRVYELQREAGPEGGSLRLRYFRRSCLFRHQERPVQGHQAGLPGGSGPAHRGAGRHLSQSGGAPSL